MEYSLYVDELGESVPFRYKNSPYFILTGCIVENSRRRDVMEDLKHIKFKYWNSTSIVLHSTKIGRKEKDFSIFNKNLKGFNNFTNDLKDFFASCPVSLIHVVVDLEKARKQNWTQQTVLSRSYGFLLENYIRFLIARKSKGKFVQEASTHIQDITIYGQFSKYQSMGIPTDKIDALEVKNHITGLSFITKKSNDSLSQLADLLGYGVKMEVLVLKKGKKVKSLNSYQKMIRGAAKGKLIYINPSSRGRKRRAYSNFEPIKIIP